MASPRTKTKAQQFWIYNPLLDLTIGCGAWSAPLLLLTYATASANALAWAVAFYALALAFNYPHFMATIYRAYHTAEDFNKYRIFTVHITALLALTLLITHFWFRMLPLIFTLYITWSPWHYTGQNYGLFMMFARRAGANPSPTERRALYATFMFSFAILFLSFHTGISNDPLFVSLGIPQRIANMALAVFSIGFVACAGFGLSRLYRQIGMRLMLPSLTLFSTQFLWFLLPTFLAYAVNFQIPQSRYSTGVLAVMHSAQYLWITSYYAKREALAEGTSKWRPWAYFMILVAGGIALFIPGPWLASRVFHYDFTASFLIFTALVNIHHFILDGTIWKLRDGRIAALLLNSREQLSSSAAEVTSLLGRAVQWLVSASPAARALRIASAVLLLSWAGLDQARYVLAVNATDVEALQRAAAMNPYDTAVQMRIARSKVELGASDEAVAAWRRAIAANPSDPAPRNALLQFFTANQRFEEAYDLAKQSIARSPKDVDLLVNLGILANQLGHNDEAAQNWQKAIALDHKQVFAHLYLADLYDHQGKPETAIPEYAYYLEKITHGLESERPPIAQTASVVLRLADAQSRSKQTAPSLRSYQLAEQLAAQAEHDADTSISQPAEQRLTMLEFNTVARKLQAIAAAGEAEQHSQLGNSSEAMIAFQRALKLDGTLDDRRTEATDWYNFARLLLDQKHSTRLAFAASLRAESLLKSEENQLHTELLSEDNRPRTKLPQSQPAELATVISLRVQVEHKLGPKGVAEVRRNPQPVIEEALRLTH